MARSKHHALSSITFRMAGKSSKISDQPATLNSHDRTMEIKRACRHWIEIKGVFGTKCFYAWQYFD